MGELIMLPSPPYTLSYSPPDAKQVTIDDKAKRLEEMLQERTEQLQSLAAVLNRNKQ